MSNKKKSQQRNQDYCVGFKPNSFVSFFLWSCLVLSFSLLSILLTQEKVDRTRAGEVSNQLKSCIEFRRVFASSLVFDQNKVK